MSALTKQDKQTARKRKTVHLDTLEKKALRDFARKYQTLEETATALRMNRATLSRIMELGRGSADSIAHLRAMQVNLKI